MITELKIIEKCAEAAHEMNRLYCEARGDESQIAWEQSPSWQKKSSIEGVNLVLRGSTPKQQHESWLIEKAETGWKYGPIKDPEKKEHPCFVPYEQLPQEEKVKDYLFIQTVRNMYNSLMGTVLLSL